MKEIKNELVLYTFFLKNRATQATLGLIMFVILLCLGLTFPKGELRMINTADRFAPTEKYIVTYYLNEDSADDYQEQFEHVLSEEEISTYVEDDLRNINRIYEDFLYRMRESIAENNQTEIIENNIYLARINKVLLELGLKKMFEEPRNFKNSYSLEKLSSKLFEMKINYFMSIKQNKPAIGFLEYWLNRQQAIHPILSISAGIIILAIVLLLNREYHFKVKHSDMIYRRPINKGKTTLFWMLMNGIFISLLSIGTYLIGLLGGLIYYCLQFGQPLIKGLVDILNSDSNFMTLSSNTLTIILGILLCIVVFRLILLLVKNIYLASLSLIFLYACPYLLLLKKQLNWGFTRFNPFIYIELDKIISNFRAGIGVDNVFPSLSLGWQVNLYLLLLIGVVTFVIYLISQRKVPLF